ncbi:MAG: hypothetical protein ACYC9K_05045 [Sulfuricaulis sp.]
MRRVLCHAFAGIRKAINDSGAFCVVSSPNRLGQNGTVLQQTDQNIIRNLSHKCSAVTGSASEQRPYVSNTLKRKQGKIRLSLNKCIAVVLLLGHIDMAAAVDYTITDVTPQSNIYSDARGINNNGEVTGLFFNTGEGYEHAYLYSGGALIDLGTLGGGSSEGYGINDKGQVVGCSQLADWRISCHAFLYSSGTMTDLGTVGGSNSGATAINNNGQVVGASSPTGDPFVGFPVSHAFLYSGGVMTDLGTFGGYNSAATAINDNGDVVGYANTGVTDHAFLYSGGAMTDLGTLPGYATSYAVGINNSGEIAGNAASARGCTWNSIQPCHAFLYSGGAMTDLGTLPGYKNSFALSINNSGQVVGVAQTAGAPAFETPFLYSNGSMVDLNSLLPANSGWQLLNAYGINDAGQITGSGNHNGGTHAFLMTPANYTIKLSRADGSVQNQTIITSVEPTDWVSTASGNNIAKLIAQVTDQNGNPVPNIGVSIKSTVTAYSGGHQHDDNDRQTNYAGLLNLPGVTATAQNSTNVLTGTTDNNGDLAFWFTSPTPAGDHELTASCTGCTRQGPKQVWVGVKNLHWITDSPNYVLIIPNRDIYHPYNHYIQDPANAHLEELAFRYHAKFDHDPVLYLNDSSLERGGLFDIDIPAYTDVNGVLHSRTPGGKPGAWWVPPHKGHRRGDAVDIRANGSSTAIPPANYKKFIRIASSLKMIVIPELNLGHFHVCLNGVCH